MFFDGYCDPATEQVCEQRSRKERVGRRTFELSLVPSVVDQMLEVEDVARIATARWVSKRLGRTIGGSTGLNVYAGLKLACEIAKFNWHSSIVTIICDLGPRYEATIHNPHWWLTTQGLMPAFNETLESGKKFFIEP